MVCFISYLIKVLGCGDLSLRRWKKTPDGARTEVPSAVTHEVLLRLVSDFAAALAE